MDLEQHIKLIGSLKYNDKVISASAIDDLSVIAENYATVFLSSVPDEGEAACQKLSVLNIARFDSYAKYKLCADAVSSSDVVMFDASSQLDAKGLNIIDVAMPEISSDAANKKYVDECDELLSGKIDEVSADASKLSANDAMLSNAIDEKIFIDELSTASLCAIHISQDDFYQKVIDGKVLSNEMHVVSSSYINAYGEQMKNLAEPTDLSDAATKGYVDAQIGEQADALASDESISAFYDIASRGLQNVEYDLAISALFSVIRILGHKQS